MPNIKKADFENVSWYMEYVYCRGININRNCLCQVVYLYAFT